ncbi:MAG: sulfotransferase family protein [Microthrixaceae bacterium]
MKPTFLVIGAQKAATTSLYHYLGAHPDVFVSPGKELNYFVLEQGWSNGAQWYEAQFDGAGAAHARGEASPSYTMFPAFTGVPARIADLIPDVRLVYLVRHPIERMRSSYLHGLSRGGEHRPIDVALVHDLRYQTATMYGMQVQQYLHHFPREQLLVIRSEDLRDRRDDTLRLVFAHLGVDADASMDGARVEHHRSEHKQVPRAAARSLLQLEWYARAVDAAPEVVRRAHGRLTRRPLRPADTELSAVVERGIIERLRPDLTLLCEQLQIDTDPWGLL